MDFVNKALGGNSSSNENQQPSNTEQKSEGGSGGFLGGIGDKLNNAGGGGAQGEKDEDALDKGTVIQFPLPLPLPPHATTSLTIPQVSTSSKRNSSAKARKTTRAPWSRPRTSRSATSSAGSTRAPRGAMCR